MPTDVAFTTRSAAARSAASSSARPTRPRSPARAAATAARSAVRFTTVTWRAPAAARAPTTARAAPPAPSTTQRRSAGTKPTGSSASEARKPTPSVLWPTSRDPSRTTQFTASRARACSLSSSTRWATSRLVRHGHRQTVDAQRPHAVEGGTGATRFDLEGEEDPVQPGGGEGGVVDGRRARVAGGVADERRQPGLPADGRARRRQAHPPRRPCCWASFLARRKSL